MTTNPQAPKPFNSSESAWMWCMEQLVKRRNGEHTPVVQHSPFSPDDIVKCLDRLYRRHRVDLVHVRILRIWGERQVAPNPAFPLERSDWRLWREALDRLEPVLRVKGIVS